MAKYSNEYKESLISRYENGESYYSISKTEGLTITTIRRWVDRKYLINNLDITDEIIKNIIEDYKSGIGVTKLQRKYGILEHKIKNILIKNNISKISHPNKTKNINYFEKIDTPEKADILGFIIADGNISSHNNQYSLKIHLQKEDVSILNFISKELDSSCSIKIKENSGLESCYVSYTSRKLIEDLIKLGVVPNKTGKEYLPFDLISEELHKDLISGFFDGDGGLRTNGIVSFCSSNLKLLETLQKKMNLNRKIIFDRNCYSFTLLKKDSEIFYKEYYQKSPFQLKRKKERFEYVFDNCPLP